MNIRSVVHLDKLLAVNTNQGLSRFGVGGVCGSWQGQLDLARRVFVPRDSLRLLSEVMVAYRRIAFGHRDNCGGRKG